MKILVTGGCGFIGTNLVLRLLESTSNEIINLDALTYAANPQSLADAAETSRYHFVKGDIGDVAFVAKTIALHQPDAIIHLAAESHVDRSIQSPSQFVQTNVVGTFNLLLAAQDHYSQLSRDRRKSFRFLHVSTDEVYGSLGQSGEFTETSRYDPHSPYSASKAASDHFAKAWHDTYGLPVIVTHCSNNYGPFQFPEKLIPLMIVKCIQGESLPVYGSGTNIRDWLHVADHVAALQLILASGVPGETYNIGGDCQLQNIDLVNRVCKIMDSHHPCSSGKPHSDRIDFVTDRPGHDFRYAIDATKVKDQLGWRASHCIDQGLIETVKWYLSNASWWQSILDSTYQLERLGMKAEQHQPAAPNGASPGDKS